MIGVITVHHKTSKWLEIQLGYLRKFIPKPWALFIDLNFDHSNFNLKELSGSAFVYIRKSKIIPKKKIHHHTKLGCLESAASKHGEIDTYLFLDGDAFPFTSIVPILVKLPKHKLIAVQRSRELGDTFPHPCFTLVEAPFWKRIKGTWKMGRKHVEAFNTRLDKTAKWLPLTQTGALTDNKLFFSVYGNVVYHHGAGFRVPIVFKYKGYQDMIGTMELGDCVFNDINNNRINWDQYK